MTRTGTTKANGQKHELDKFYTKSSVAADCLKLLDLSSYARIIEPSAGAGAFSDHLHKDPSLPVLAFDVAPENPSVTQQDWFEYDTTTPSPTLVVGNPPFGQQCTLAVRFINHAFEVVGANTVAFVLPRSFRKDSIQNRLFVQARLVQEKLLDKNSFELEGADYNLNAVFQIWERTTVDRVPKLAPITSDYFTFAKKNEPHDLAVRRVGGKAGHAFVDTPETSDQSNYFIKVTKQHKAADVITMVNGLDFSVADDGTGPRTLSKRELVTLFDAGYSASFLPRKSATC
jgi:predicted RNA methylase